MDKTKWTEEQKKALLSLVKINIKQSGGIEWSEVAQQLPFTKQQCQVQFNNLRRRDSSVKNDDILSQRRNHQWSKEEEEILIKMAELYGKNWETIANNFFPSLTPQKLKNKYAQILKSQEASEQSISSYTYQRPVHHELIIDKQPGPVELINSLPNINLSSYMNQGTSQSINTKQALYNIELSQNQLQIIDFNLLRNINDISIIDSARLFMLDSARGQ
ncbi:Myb-like DNA-binding domain-containing protein [Spironucleus salmonicida]|uniref:Myb-like DNA-binding domain-containing protein n=1 Tax=Spironucleus salmonicida TaxID=348837 RepID=V6LM50_9EUKA|nr:Myb-like DNA-binding domain-containing protein [Spironucleus salmonicida]|eukprot:EST45293.1 Myb-like DNA-binding domain-containing protein [Spironucleus salmonicida]